MPLVLRTYLLFWLYLLITALPTAAQLQVWRHMNTSEMANPNIVCIAEDKSGLLYLGTHEGIEMFDGKRFLPLEIPNRIERGINPFINVLRWGKGGVLWVATRSHVFTYSPSTGTINIVYEKGLLQNINGLEIDTVHQLLYICHHDRILTYHIAKTGVDRPDTCMLSEIYGSTLSEKGVLYALVNYNSVVKVEGRASSEVYHGDFVKDLTYLRRKKALALITSAGIVTIGTENEKTDTSSVTANWDYRSPQTRISALADDEVIVRHVGGIDLVYDLEDTNVARFIADENNPAGLRADVVIFATSDHRKNIWISENGDCLSVLPYNSRHLRFIPAKMTGATRLWLTYNDASVKKSFTATQKGLFALEYGNKNIKYRNGICPRGEKTFDAKAMIPWRHNELLVLTNGCGSWTFNTQTYQFKQFDSLNRRFAKKSFWGGKKVNESNYIFYAYHGAYLYQRKTGKIAQFMRDSMAQADGGVASMGAVECMSCFVDRKGRMWFGGGYGIDVFDSAMHHLKNYGNSKDGRHHGLATTVVMDINQGADGTMYVATMGGGIYKLSDADTFCQLPLVGNATNIYKIGIENEEHLIITTSRGMCLYNIKTGKSRLLNEPYGMPIVDFNQFALSVDSQFVMGSGTTGITLIDRNHLVDLFYDTARILVMKGLQPISGFTLGKGQQQLDFDVAIPGHLANANWEISYKLEGLDEEWHKMTKGEWHIRFNSISPGSYKLRIAATDLQNVVWAAPAVVQITALPFFWQTLWFRVLILVIVIVAFAAVVRYLSQLQLKWKLKKLEDEQKLARERARISRELHDNVGSNLTYLISGLESSNILLQKKQTETLERKIEKMRSSAKESMQQLRDSIWALNSESVAASLLLSRFGTWAENIIEAAAGTNLTIIRNVTTDVDLDPIKSLNLFRIMQEAVHNVVKHAHASELSVIFNCDGNRIEIVMEDNGKGFTSEDKKGNGTKTMASRAEEIGAAYTLITEIGRGTRISIDLELK
jgi:signal transduction histidine kinase